MTFKDSLLKTAEIKEKCQPFIRACRGQPMFRGQGFTGDVVKRTKVQAVRKDRQPRDTSERVHQLMDDWFEEHVGMRTRSEAIFCTGSQAKAKMFGKTYYVFPVGDFKYVWGMDDGHGMSDTISVARQIRDSCAVQPRDKGPEMADKVLSDYSWKTTNLFTALREGAEIAILCDEVFLVPTFGTDTQWEEFFAKLT